MAMRAEQKKFEVPHLERGKGFYVEVCAPK